MKSFNPEERGPHDPVAFSDGPEANAAAAVLTNLDKVGEQSIPKGLDSRAREILSTYETNAGVFWPVSD